MGGSGVGDTRGVPLWGHSPPPRWAQVLQAGRFSAVWRGTLQQRPVAIKAFAAGAARRWAAERAVHELPLMEHENVAKLLGTRGAGPCARGGLLVLQLYPAVSAGEGGGLGRGWAAGSADGRARERIAARGCGTRVGVRGAHRCLWPCPAVDGDVWPRSPTAAPLRLQPPRTPGCPALSPTPPRPSPPVPPRAPCSTSFASTSPRGPAVCAWRYPWPAASPSCTRSCGATVSAPRPPSPPPRGPPRATPQSVTPPRVRRAVQTQRGAPRPQQSERVGAPRRHVRHRGLRARHGAAAPRSQRQRAESGAHPQGDHMGGGGGGRGVGGEGCGEDGPDACRAAVCESEPGVRVALVQAWPWCEHSPGVSMALV